jgi:hypothetical protein
MYIYICIYIYLCIYICIYIYIYIYFFFFFLVNIDVRCLLLSAEVDDIAASVASRRARVSRNGGKSVQLDWHPLSR